mgnify:FL=1
MFHAHLPRLPQWARMESIDRTCMRIRYAPPSLAGPVTDESTLPVQTIAFDPPLQGTTDTRKRLVAMSEAGQAANAQFARAKHSRDFWGEYNLETLLEHADVVLMHRATPVALLAVACALMCTPTPPAADAPARWLARGVYGVHSAVHMAAVPLVLLLVPMCAVLAVRCVAWLSRVWTNAAPVPTEPALLASWAWATLTTPTLPRLDRNAWNDETVVITGGARGFGAELALRLSQKGARVITLDIAKTTVKHPNLVAYHCDISRQNEVLSVTRNILYRHGAPTMLINNAAVRNGHPLLDTPVGDIARVLDTNTMAHFWTLKEFLPPMVEKRRGHIVTVSSMMGQTGVAQMIDYVASKHALVGLHESLRFELDAIYKTPFVRTTLVTTGHLQETSMFSGIQYNAFARFLAPPVSTAKVANAVIDALECQESRIVAIPWYAAWTPFLRVLPSFVRDGIQALLGANHSMTTASKPPREGERAPDTAT